ncbi:MAG TPA: O-antigen ligase family protein [Candidatus Portnoybacteria bacterium]|jgi:O-antigen ligase|nr:O-antigen ligase family protein [Candidatus Portnoybacteria bacterium]MDD5752142.1 O-antigen ligase family protein [Candidatus Portnoybacteria bacterium]HOZ16462.1 O-antigen ligase family protein [Candidatus Portnoybacteria bacterium]HPH52106.1 O-antigen ligase family protein [Candidatus Portnoybacteria bacterium]HPJ80281.1 O-antigen ligase family protein [Candidatus Portnoybacteria bacterium]
MKILKQGACLVVFCLPLYLIRFEILKIPTTMLELLICALFILWVFQGVHRSLWTVIKYERLLIWGVFLLFLGVSLATIFSWDAKTSAGIWKAWFVDPILFFMIFITVIKKEDVEDVFKSMILSGFVVALISLIYLICGNLNYQGRLQGVFNSPNYLAMYLAIPLLLSLGFFLRFPLERFLGNCLKGVNGTAKGAAWKTRGIYGVIFITIAVVLSFTQSFGALLGIIGAVGLGAVFYLYQKNKKALALSLVVVGSAAILIIGLIKIQSLEGLKSFDARFVIWKGAVNAFFENPFTGIGPGTFEYYFPPYPKWGVPQPHNVFLAFLIQTGLPGFVGFILILIWFYKNNAKNLALLCSMTYILAHGLVDTTYWKNDLSVVFWIMIGITAVLQFYRIKSAVPFIHEK